MKKTNSVSVLAVIITTTAIVGILSAIATPVYAHKLTATSYDDGWSKGLSDAECDAHNCHGHGFDDSCPSSHTDVFVRDM